MTSVGKRERKGADRLTLSSKASRLYRLASFCQMPGIPVCRSFEGL